MNAILGRWLICVALMIVVGVAWTLAGDMWGNALGGWGGVLVLLAIPPTLAAVSAAPSMRPAIYLINGMTCVLVLMVVLAFVPSDVDEPFFSRPVAAALYGAAMLFALGLTALPIVLCRRQTV